MNKKSNFKKLYKNSRVKVSWLWILFLFSMWYTNNLKTLFFIFVMLSIHELAHIGCAKLFHYEIDKVIIYPFGLCAQMKYIGYGNVFKELLIIIAGPLVHLFFPIIFQFLMKYKLISIPYMEYLNMLNMSILIFNLLPVYPLDGGRILQSMYHFVFSFKHAQIATFITSLMNILLLYHYRFLNGISGVIILLFLGMQIMIGLKDLTFSQLTFYHYRYMHPVKGRDKLNKTQDLYRSRHNIMVRKSGWMAEREWLTLRFHQTDKEIKPHFLI